MPALIFACICANVGYAGCGVIFVIGCGFTGSGTYPAGFSGPNCGPGVVVGV